MKIVEHQNNVGQYNTNIFFVSFLEMTVITSFLHGLVTQFLTTRKKNFKNGHDLLSPTGKLVLFWQMTIFVILIKVEFLSPQVRPVTRIGRWALYRLFIPASISGTVKVLRYIDPLTRVKTRAWIKKYYFLTKFLKSILISWSLSFPQCVLLDKFHS